MLTTADSDIIGTTESTSRLRAYIGKVARSDANVLITGETGTGKERVAETIHRMSARRERPFMCLNCAALPDSLIESELFGYERGAFTSADSPYAGKLRLADGGTVFLDEIGEMSDYAQAKCLRVVENREVFPLGARRPVNVDVRIIAATNQDLENLVEARRFRRDLYYRLNVARLALPPLREHKEDLPALLLYYLEHFNRRCRAQVRPPSEELMSCLMAYEWPGNVRELRNLIEGVFIDPPAGPIRLQDVPESFQKILATHVRPSSDERERLLEILKATNWNKSRAATALRWSRMTLYRKLSKYRIDSSERRRT